MKLTYDFYHRPCVEVAQDLVGKVLVHRVGGEERRLRITETEAYCGEATPPAMQAGAARSGPRSCTWRRGPSIFTSATGSTGC